MSTKQKRQWLTSGKLADSNTCPWTSKGLPSRGPGAAQKSILSWAAPSRRGDPPPPSTHQPSSQKSSSSFTPSGDWKRHLFRFHTSSPSTGAPWEVCYRTASLPGSKGCEVVEQHQLNWKVKTVSKITGGPVSCMLETYSTTSAECTEPPESLKTFITLARLSFPSCRRRSRGICVRFTRLLNSNPPPHAHIHSHRSSDTCNSTYQHALKCVFIRCVWWFLVRLFYDCFMACLEIYYVI